MIIPFFIPHSGCPHQCIFCNQKHITGQNNPPDISLIPPRISEYLKARTSSGPVQIAFYGGSFTALPLEMQQSYLETTRPFIASGRIRNIRVSTRPDAINDEILAFLQSYHVTIVELGVQSLNDGVLTRSGRGHTAMDAVNAVNLLKSRCFTVGIQLMPGLPGDSHSGFLETVVKTIALRPDFVRLYPALVIKGTPLETLYKAGNYTPLMLDEAVALCRESLCRFEQAGIDVIRIGLQPTEELEKPGTILAGPFHPAFRQLVEASILLDKMRTVLTVGKKRTDVAVIRVNPGDLSAAIGHKSVNRETLKKEFNLRDICFQADTAVPARAVIID